TIDVFKGQLEKYRGVDYEDDDGNITPTPVTNDMQVVHDFTNDLRYVDATQKMKYDVDGSIVFSFGKYNGKPVGETLSKDKQYFNWILNKEFSSQVKQIVKRLVREYENQ
ncbi:MAG: 3'-5' exonuclease, partial [bacterium]|nr:3'-5' exonuclease [bacterium]